MLPIGRGHGELINGCTFLCKVEYDISPPLTFVSVGDMQRVEMVVRDKACEHPLHIAGIALVLEDGSRHRLPKPLKQRHGDCYLECFLATDFGVSDI